MKKNKQSSKKNRNMATKSISKNTTFQSVTDYLVEILSSVLDDEEVNSVRLLIEEHQSELQKIITKNLPKQKSSTPKKIKDPNAPKRGKSSYIFFCLDKRQEIINDSPDLSATDVIKELGRVWREEMSDEDKKKYVAQSVTDKERYQAEMSNYTPSDICFLKKKVKRKGPKRGRTSYIYFCTDQRPIIKEENPEMNTKEVTSQLGVQWKSLTDEDKKPYAKLAAKDKSRYEKEKSEWVDPDDELELDTKKDKKSVSKKDKKKKKKKKKKKSKPRKKSGYILFCQEERDVLKNDNPDLTNHQVTKELGATWKALTYTEQAEYDERAADETSEVSE